jgi:hypothetical protein
MKKFIIPLALMALLGTVAVSCQKDASNDNEQRPILLCGSVINYESAQHHNA